MFARLAHFVLGHRLAVALALCVVMLSATSGAMRIEADFSAMAFFGGGDPAVDRLIEFKERWGARSRPVFFHDLHLGGSAPDISKYYDSETLVRRTWKRLPLAATSVLGGPLNRWFC